MPIPALDVAARDLWPLCGWSTLEHAPNGWLRPTAGFFARVLARPELALVEESCAAERRLHGQLQADPLHPVPDGALAALRDADARENYQHCLHFRDGLIAQGSLEAWLLALFRAGHIHTPPLFIDFVIQAITRELLVDCTDPLEVRAAELLFRPQRITLHEGRVLAGDRETLDLQVETGGFGDLGRLLVQAKAALKPIDLAVLGDHNAERFWDQATADHGAAPLPARPDPRGQARHGPRPELHGDRIALRAQGAGAGAATLGHAPARRGRHDPTAAAHRRIRTGAGMSASTPKRLRC